MVKIYPRAEFKADFPSDYVEEDDEIVQLGCRGVANAICEIMRQAGFEASEPEHQFEHGWDFIAIVDGRRIWVQISDLVEYLVLMSEPNHMLFKKSKKNQNAHSRLLLILHNHMQQDARFREIQWFPYISVAGEIGRESPVEA